MTQQAHDQPGRMLHSWKTVLFISALLMFIFTVVYRMAKSASFSNAVAALVESLLIVFFFIFLGILLAYLVYYLYYRFRQGSRRQQAYNQFDFSSGHKETAGKPDPNDKIESSSDST